MEYQNNEIDQLIAKFLAGEALPEEAIELEDWKSISDENLQYFHSCEKIFNNGKTVQITAKETNVAWQKINQQINDASNTQRTKKYVSYLKIAASIALLLVIANVAYWLLSKEKTDTLSYQSTTTNNSINLLDSTKIELFTNSSIDLDPNFGKSNRLIHLNGNAYFEIKHDEKLPFIIETGNVFIKDIGTKFKVTNSSDSDTVYVHVDEGIVLLFDSVGSEITITAKQNAMYIRSTKQIISESKSIIPIQLEFNNTRLIDVVKIISEKYTTPIKLESVAIENCLLTTKFNNESLETVLLIISETLGLNFRKNNEGYIISGAKCN